MMHSNRTEYSHRRPYSDRGSQLWDDYDDRREEIHEPQRHVRRDSYVAYDKYNVDGQSRTERFRSTREYSDSPQTLYSKDVIREWGRKSPVRRRRSSPDRNVSEKKGRMFPEEEDKDYYRYKHEPEDKPYRPSPDKFSHKHRTKEHKHTRAQEEDFKYKKISKESRYSYRHEEIPYKQRPDDSTYRHGSGYYTGREGQERSCDHSGERTQSQECDVKGYPQPRERSDGYSTDHTNKLQNTTLFQLNGSSGQSFEHHVMRKSPVPEARKSTKGFQRFLDVLNKGVNVDILTEIVNQPSIGTDDRPRSSASFQRVEDGLWSPRSCWKQQEGPQSAKYCRETEESGRQVSPRPCYTSFSPKGHDVSNDKSVQSREGGRSNFSFSSRSVSPPVLERAILCPEDEHKHRQIQDVLQAIGMDLGFEELGQMSHRIKERLYGKDSDRSRDPKESKELNRRRLFSPRQRSRSSSKSSVSPVSQDYYRKNESQSVPRDETDLHRPVECSHQSSSSSLKDSEKSETCSRESTAAFQTSPLNNLFSVPETPVTPLTSGLPANTPMSYAPLTYTAPPPNMAPIGPQFFLPHLPPFLPYPPVPSLNMFPAVLAERQHLLTPHISNYPPTQLFNFQDIHPPPPLNTSQKSKPVTRPRCLQVIDTKQVG